MENSAGFHLQCPTKQEAIQLYTQVFDATIAQEIWQEACDAQELPYHNVGIDELEKVFDYLAVQNGTIGVYGMSLKVKILSYRIVARKKLPT